MPLEVRLQQWFITYDIEAVTPNSLCCFAAPSDFLLLLNPPQHAHSVAALPTCCLQMLASNMTPWQAPPVAALPFGANSTRYVALELHYNNPERLTGQRDTGSGIR
jgi:hypothetical protein